MKKYTVALCFFLCVKMAQAECLKAETKIIYQRKAEMAEEILCEKNIGKIVFYVSKSCVNDQCAILKRPKKTLAIKDYHGNFGSPGFKLCAELGGVPQIFDYKFAKTDWKTAARCFFGKDFVEISLLTQEWKSMINDQ